MNVGELFVNLGIKGADKTVGAISSTTKGLGEAKGMAIETKAAIIGAMYAVERLFASSGALGTAMVNFNSITGLSTKQMQQYQYAAQQAGATNEEFTGTVMSITKAMAGIDLQKGVPQGLMLLSQAAGGFDFKDKNDPFKVIDMVQKGIRNMGTGPRAKAIEAYLAESLGIRGNVLAAAQQGQFNEKNFRRAPIIGEGSLNANKNTNIAFKNIESQWSKMIADLSAKYGPGAATDIGNLSTAIMNLTKALSVLADKLGIPGVIDAGVGWLSTGLNDIAGAHKKGDNERLFGKDSVVKKIFDWRDDQDKKFLLWMQNNFSGDLPELSGKSAIPKAPPVPTNTAPQVNVKQDLHFQHEGKNAGEVGRNVASANQEAFRQFSTQVS